MKKTTVVLVFFLALGFSFTMLTTDSLAEERRAEGEGVGHCTAPMERVEATTKKQTEMDGNGNGYVCKSSDGKFSDDTGGDEDSRDERGDVVDETKPKEVEVEKHEEEPERSEHGGGGRR